MKQRCCVAEVLHILFTSAMKQRWCCCGFTYIIYECNEATVVLQRLCAMKQILLVLSCPWKWASKAVDSMAHSFIFWDKMAFQISSEITHVRDRFDEEWQIVPIVDYLLSGKVVQVSIGYWHWKEIIIVIPDPSATLVRNWREHVIEGSRQLAIGIFSGKYCLVEGDEISYLKIFQLLKVVASVWIISQILYMPDGFLLLHFEFVKCHFSQGNCVVAN